MKILFATSEVHPLIKTGGLADVSGSLPAALRKSGHDVRIVIPAYPQAKKNAQPLKPLSAFKLPGSSKFVTLFEGHLPDSGVPVYLIDIPEYFDREGGPYSKTQGSDWPDNADRFACYCRAAYSIAMDAAGLDWQPDVVHCNDWQTGLIPAFLADQQKRPATLFTIHNLAYQGLFDQSRFHALQLPEDWWSMHHMEFHGHFSFIKGGIVNADWLTTVSPTYAKEICTAQFGYGLEGLLRHRQTELSGILNGIDETVWNPATDKYIAQTYTADTLAFKKVNKRRLQEALGLEVNPDIPLLGHVGRLVEQKGVDLILDLIPELSTRKVQLALIGTGNSRLEAGLRAANQKTPKAIGIGLEYDEGLSHLLEAGADMFLMPSRFEPCGLNQMYSLRYGTPPIARKTGGLADSIVHSSPATVANHTANGFLFKTQMPPLCSPRLTMPSDSTGKKMSGKISSKPGWQWITPGCIVPGNTRIFTEG